MLKVATIHKFSDTNKKMKNKQDKRGKAILSIQASQLVDSFLVMFICK